MKADLNIIKFRQKGAVHSIDKSFHLGAHILLGKCIARLHLPGSSLELLWHAIGPMELNFIMQSSC